MGAIVQLKVSDVYDSAGKVRDSITFAGSTRKSSKHGRANTRQITFTTFYAMRSNNTMLPYLLIWELLVIYSRAIAPVVVILLLAR